MRILFLNWAPIITFGLAAGFQQLGHEVEILRPEEDSTEGMLHRIAACKPDVLLTEGGVGREDVIFPVLEQSGISHVYWGIEDPVAYNLSLAYGKRSVLTLTTHREWLQEIYEPAGVEAICIPFACNPAFHRKGLLRPEFHHELVFVGNNYENHPHRIEGHRILFDACLQADLPLVFYGDDNWVNGKLGYQVPPNAYKGYFGYLDWPDLCASSAFILGVHSIGNSSTMQSMRTFEVLGCGGFFLTQHTPAIEHMFENHKHLVWTQSPEETVELVRYYQARPDAMKRIRTEGQNHAYANHTYRHRAEDIVARLGALTGLR
ncbi:hypothetical protein SY83_01810 [Paenibacillus swuensis]|uniref:DUF3880 domain-containing protein n=1 Tax=Paenibacillus swuensis TaxID=1178515 RepID=A0A172TER0_9BACL|nr:glycosyltransferase [Paenibacillus swuensis]ANE45273.1 hypothetical protein SY83_01810 [Paenibacillus swuensis]